MKPWLRNTLLAVGGVVLVIVVALVGLVAWVASSMPSSQGARVEIREGLVGVDTGGSYAWIVRTEGGAVLVDAGMDPQASAIKAELSAMGLAPEDVTTVLLTHAHGDHTAGLGQFPHATLVHGPNEAGLLYGTDVVLGPAPSLMASMFGPPTLPAEVVEASDGQLLDIDGEQVTVIATPGHTLGSASYQWGDVLFVGDAVFNAGDHIMVSPSFLNSDDAAAQRSARRLGPLDAEWMADGHAGRTEGADPMLDALASGS